MINLVDAIDTIRETCYVSNVDKPHFNEEGAQEIRGIIYHDRLINSITESYDAILVNAGSPDSLVEGTKLVGDVFFDERKRFPDGYCIFTSQVQSVEKLRHELYLVKTKNTTYLVIA